MKSATCERIFQMADFICLSFVYRLSFVIFLSLTFIFFAVILLLILGTIIDHITLKIECDLLYAMVLNILVGRGDVTVSGLVTGDNYALGIGKVTDSRILQRIELVTITPFQMVAHDLPSLVELVAAHALRTGLEFVAEKIAVAGALEYAKVEHELYDGLVQANFRVLVVFAEFMGNEDCLVLDTDVTDLQMAELTRTDKCVILHETSQEEVFVMFSEVSGHCLQHLWSKVLAELLMLCHYLDTLDGIGADVLARHQELCETVKPTTVIVTCAWRALTVKINPVDEVCAERLIKLISIL